MEKYIQPSGRPQEVLGTITNLTEASKRPSDEPKKTEQTQELVECKKTAEVERASNLANKVGDQVKKAKNPKNQKPEKGDKSDEENCWENGEELSNNQDVLTMASVLEDRELAFYKDKLNSSLSSGSARAIFGEAKNVKAWKIIPKRMVSAISDIYCRNHDKLLYDFRTTKKLIGENAKGFYTDIVGDGVEYFGRICTIRVSAESSSRIVEDARSNIKGMSIDHQSSHFAKLVLLEEFSLYKELAKICGIPGTISLSRLLRRMIPQQTIIQSIGILGSFLRYFVLLYLDWFKFIFPENQKLVLEQYKLSGNLSDFLYCREKFLPFLEIQNLCDFLGVDTEQVGNANLKILEKYLTQYNNEIFSLLKNLSDGLQNNFIGVFNPKAKARAKRKAQAPTHKPLKRQKTQEGHCPVEDCRFLIIKKEVQTYDASKKSVHWEKDVGTYDIPNFGKETIRILKDDRDLVDSLTISGEKLEPGMLKKVKDATLLEVQYILSASERRRMIRAKRSNQISDKISYYRSVRRKIEAKERILIDETFKIDLKMFLDSEQKHIESQCLIYSSMKSFKSYPWDDSSLLSALEAKNRYKPQSDLLVHSRDYEPQYSQKVPHETQKFLCFCFGTWGQLLDEKVSESWSPEQTMAYLEGRFNELRNFGNSWRVTQSSDKSCANYFIKFLQHLKRTSELDVHGSKYIGFQTKDSLTSRDITEFPLEACLKVDSTVGKLFIVKNYILISNIQKTVRQRSLKKVYGFTSTELPKTFEANRSDCCLLSPSDQEIKMHLISQIKEGLSDMSSVLTPYLQYKALVEISVRKKQCSNKDFEEVFDPRESLHFELFCILTGYLAIMKLPFVLFDRLFRIKVFCKRHKGLQKGQKAKLPCRCLYGFDLETMTRGYEQEKGRESLKEEHLMKYFFLDQETQKYRIKEECQQDLSEYYEKRFISQNEHKHLKEAFGADFDINF